jgi:hypothetical protein
MQRRSLVRSKRKHGPDVWQFRWSERGPNGKRVYNKKFHIEFCTVAHWKNGEIVEKKLFYDLVGLLKQIGVM